MANTRDVYLLKSSRAPWRRAGIVFPSRGVEIAVDADQLTADQLKLLKGDPGITVTKRTVDLDAEAKAAADQAKADADATAAADKAVADAAAKAQADADAKAAADKAKADADAKAAADAAAKAQADADAKAAADKAAADKAAADAAKAAGGQGAAKS